MPGATRLSMLMPSGITNPLLDFLTSYTLVTMSTDSLYSPHPLQLNLQLQIYQAQRPWKIHQQVLPKRI